MIKNNAKYFFLVLALHGLMACDSRLDTKQKGSLNNSLSIVNIGRLISGGHLPLAIVEKKFLKNLRSFTLNAVQNHDWNDVVVDLNSGRLEGAFMLSPLAMNLIREGFQGKIVLLANRNGNGLILSNRIKSIEALKVRKSIIAVPHKYSQQHVLLQVLLSKYGISKGLVKIVVMPPKDMIYSLRNGEIDGLLVGEPDGIKVVNTSLGWMAAISPQIWEGHMDHVLLVTNKFINEEPEKLQEFINELVRAGSLIEKNPRQAAIMGEDYTGSAAELFEQVLTTPANWITYTNMVARESEIASMAEKMVTTGLWSGVPRDLMAGYFDMQFASQAEQLIRVR